MFKGLLGTPHGKGSVLHSSDLLACQELRRLSVLDILKEKHPQARSAVPEAITDPLNDDSVQPHPIIFEQITANTIRQSSCSPILRCGRTFGSGAPASVGRRLCLACPLLPIYAALTCANCKAFVLLHHSYPTDPPPSLPSDYTW